MYACLQHLAARAGEPDTLMPREMNYLAILRAATWPKKVPQIVGSCGLNLASLGTITDLVLSGQDLLILKLRLGQESRLVGAKAPEGSLAKNINLFTQWGTLSRGKQVITSKI